MLFLAIILIPIMLYITMLIHEFTHYIVALLLGIKVEKLSIGKGKILLHRKIFGTEFVFMNNPMGGGFIYISSEEVLKHKIRMIPGLLSPIVIHLVIVFMLMSSTSDFAYVFTFLNLLTAFFSLVGSDGHNALMILKGRIDEVLED